MPTIKEAKQKADELRATLRKLDAITGRGNERDRDAARKQKSRAAEKIVVISRCEDKKRRAALEADDIAWLMWYFAPESGTPSPFTYDFTPQQRTMIESIRNAIYNGGDQALAASRGEGKSTIAERMLLAYTLRGVVRFAVLFAATGSLADNSLDSIKVEIEENSRLCADYPEICEPVRALENTPQRAHFQLCSGFRHDTDEPYEAAASHFTWSGQEIVLPNLPGSPAARSIIATRGLDSAVRGIKKKGRRVDVAVIDDPDTEETVRSIEQAKKLEERIDRGIAGLGGQQRGVARVMLTTLQRPECVSAWFTDPRRKPSFKGKRFRFLIKKPERMDLWESYIEQRRMDLQSGDEFCRRSHGFLLNNYDLMHAGAEVANPHRFNAQVLPDGSQLEVSALQRYYNEVARIGQDAVSTEYDNDPKDVTASSDILTADQICQKLNGYERGTVPADAAHLSAFIDVQGKLLYWAVVAWRSDFTGYVVDYGAWPGQRRSYFTLADAVPTIPDKYPGGLEAQIFGALGGLTQEILGRAWPMDGGTMKVGRCLVDANWGESTDTVYSFIRQSPFGAIMLPSHGKGIKASSSPLMWWNESPGEQKGLNWRIRRAQKRGGARYTLYDTNFWKSFLHARLFVPMGGKGALSLFKGDQSTHRMLADHLHAEYPLLVESQGRKVHEWQERPNHPDNHLLDCLTGCCVAGSMLGAALAEQGAVVKRERKTLAQLAKEAGR